jgi:hypothetical protein
MRRRRQQVNRVPVTQDDPRRARLTLGGGWPGLTWSAA